MILEMHAALPWKIGIQINMMPQNNKGKILDYLNVGRIDISIKELAFLIAKIVNFKGQINWDKSKPDGTRKTIKYFKVKGFRMAG